MFDIIHYVPTPKSQVDTELIRDMIFEPVVTAYEILK